MGSSWMASLIVPGTCIVQVVSIHFIYLYRKSCVHYVHVHVHLFVAVLIIYVHV